jgi:hypothetical protein
LGALPNDALEQTKRVDGKLPGTPFTSSMCASQLNALFCGPRSPKPTFGMTTMQWGSWRDPRIARDLKILSTVTLIIVLVLTLPRRLAVVVVVLLALGTVLAALMLLRRHPGPAAHEHDFGDVHPGINVSRIPARGLPGLIFALGIVCMFWFGLPQFRPVVVVAVVLGFLVSLVLIVVERRHRIPPSTPLGLSARVRKDEDHGKQV